MFELNGRLGDVAQHIKDNPNCTPSQIADALEMQKSNVSPILKQLTGLKIVKMSFGDNMVERLYRVSK